jgi:hypothetical protein
MESMTMAGKQTNSPNIGQYLKSHDHQKQPYMQREEKTKNTLWKLWIGVSG